MATQARAKQAAANKRSGAKRKGGAQPEAAEPDVVRQRLHRGVVNAAYLDKPAHLRTRDERFEAGRALRVSCPRESHAGFSPAEARPDPIELLIQSSEGRIEHLVPIRYGRMLASPFAFYRGAAAIMAADLADTPCTGIGVQACGDAHLMNFGAFATPERRIVFDINDFDETYPAPWEWDLKRLAASFVIASRHNGHKGSEARAAAAAVVTHYRDRMRELAEMPTLSAWYSYLDYEKLIEMTDDDELKRRRRKVLDKALQRDAAAEFVNLAHIDGGRPRIKDAPPLIYHSDEQLDPGFDERVREHNARYRNSLPVERHVLFDPAERDPADRSPLVAVRDTPERGGNAVLTFMPHTQQNFARTTALLDQLGLNILDARITPLGDGLSLDTYVVLEDNGSPIADRQRAREIEQHLWRVLQAPDTAAPAVTRRAPRQVRMFSTPTQITFIEDPVRGRTVIELIAGDRPGLLSEVGKVLLAERVDVVTARIMTVGERAEDVFYVTDDQGRPLDEATRRRVDEQLHAALDLRGAPERAAGTR